MKSTGIVRPLDVLGRIVIPKELRKEHGLTSDDAVELFVDGDKIILRKYEKRCIFCGEEDDLIDFGDKKLCRNCIAKIKQL